MFFRYVLPWRDEDARAEAGFFHLAYDAASHPRVPEWLRAELRDQLSWFDAGLPVPGRIVVSFKRRRPIHGICWFRPEADDAIRRARYVAWLMTEAGAPVREIRIADPGEVIWRDHMQIVAKPGDHVPVAFI